MAVFDHLANFHVWLHERRVYRSVAEWSAAALVLWLGVNAYPCPSPAPLWTAAELPPLPEASDNGWTAIGDDVPLDAGVPDALTDLFDTDETLETELYWQRAESNADALRAWLDAHADVLTRVEAARARPEFVDDCRIDGPCSTYDWRLAHDLALGQVVDLALRGDRRSAAALLDDLIRMDQAQLERAPGILSVLVGLVNAERAMALAGQLGELDGSTRASLRERVSGFEARSFDLGLMVQTRYLTWWTALSSESGGEALGIEDASFLALDRGLTLHGINERFARQYARAGVGDIAGSCGAGQARVQDQPLAWLHNPMGDRLLDQTDVSEFCEDIDERVAEVESTRLRVLDRLRIPGPPRCRERAR